MVNKLYIVTLEKIEQRYTKQWYKHWKKEFSKDFDVKYIDGVVMDDKIKKGAFLDINRTNKWKAEQVVNISELFDNEKIKKDDVFLFMDGWHFGITAVKYMAQLNKIPIKIFAYWHAGTWDEWDMISQNGLRRWAVFNEAGWFSALDGSFVATKYHKKLIVKHFDTGMKANKIHVVGFPMDWEKVITEEIKPKINIKNDIVVFPHRLDIEKQPQVFDKLKKKFKTLKFIKTLDVTKNKKDYYDLLSKSKICFSASLQETFGIGTVEALMLGVIPLVPNRLSYNELYDRRFIYTSLVEAEQKIEYFLKNFNTSKVQNAITKNAKKIKEQSKESYKKMIEVMKRK